MRSENKFDAVKMMREIGDKLSKEFMNLSYEERACRKITNPRKERSWICQKSTRKRWFPQLFYTLH